MEGIERTDDEVVAETARVLLLELAQDVDRFPPVFPHRRFAPDIDDGGHTRESSLDEALDIAVLSVRVLLQVCVEQERSAHEWGGRKRRVRTSVIRGQDVGVSVDELYLILLCQTLQLCVLWEDEDRLGRSSGRLCRLTA